MKSPQQLSQEIIDIIKATGNYFVGNTSGMSNDGTVNVYHPKGYSVSAIAANPISSGEVIVFNVNGTWYAFGEQRTVVKEDILVLRKSRARDDEEYSVKTIFTISNNTTETLSVYLGGDRTSKQLRKVEGYENTRFITSYSYATILNLGGDKLFTALDVATPSTDFTKSLKKNSSRYIDFVDTFYGAYDKLYLGHNYFESLDNYYGDYDSHQRIIYKDTAKYTPIIEVTGSGNINDSYGNQIKYLVDGYYKYLIYQDFKLKTLRRDNSQESITLTNTVTNTATEFSVGAIIQYPAISSYKFYHSLTYTGLTNCYWFTFDQTRLDAGMTLTYDIDYARTANITSPGNTIIVNSDFNVISNTITLDPPTVDPITASGMAITQAAGFSSSGSITLDFSTYKDKLKNNSATYQNINYSSDVVITTTLPGGFNNPSSFGYNSDIGYIKHPLDSGGYDYTPVDNVPFVTYGLKNRIAVKNYFQPALPLPTTLPLESPGVTQPLDGSGIFFANVFSPNPVTDDYYEDFTWDANYLSFEANRNYDAAGISNYIFCNRDIATSNIRNKRKGQYIEIDKVNIPTSTVIRETVEGKSVAIFTADGEIVQDYKAYIENDLGYEILFNEEYQYKHLKTRYKEPKILEERNSLTLRYGKVDAPIEILLNTNDFGIIRVDNTNKVSVSTINVDTESFTITVSDTNTRFIKNLTGALFNPASFRNQDYLFSCDINSKSALIKGTITNAIYDTNSFVLTLTCQISSIALDTPTSFYKSLILNNGSFYNYYFRKYIPIPKLPYNTWNDTKPYYSYASFSGGKGWVDFGLFMNKSVVPILPLNPSYFSLWTSTDNGDFEFYINWFLPFSNYYPEIHKTDNIVKNKIYSVVKVESRKAWVEQWDIKENGDVKYSKVFQVDYVPIKKANVDETLTIYGHSYYPKQS